jgi:hypothetical protein
MNEDKEPLNTGKFKITMEAFSEDQQATTNAVSALSEEFQNLKKALNDRNKLEHSNTEKEALKRLEAKITSIDLAVSAPKKPNRFVVQLFPEQDRKLFYKIVFGRWLLYLLLGLTIKCMCQWGLDWNEKQAIAKIETSKNERINKAWQQMYDNTDRKTKRMMDTMLHNERR